MEPFYTDDPHLKSVYAAANAIVAEQQYMAEMLTKKENQIEENDV